MADAVPDSAKKVHHRLNAVGTVGAQSVQTCLKVGVRPLRTFLRRLPSRILDYHRGHDGSILAKCSDDTPEWWANMADQLREGAVPRLAHVVSPGRSIDGRLVDVPEERRESRRLVSQALWRRHFLWFKKITLGWNGGNLINRSLSRVIGQTSKPDLLNNIYGFTYLWTHKVPLLIR